MRPWSAYSGRTETRALAVLVPTAFVAVTLTYTVVPAARLRIVQVRAGAVAVQVPRTVPFRVADHAVAVYVRMALPPVLVGARQFTTADRVAAVVVTLRGALGAVGGAVGTTVTRGELAGLAPCAFVAITST